MRSNLNLIFAGYIEWVGRKKSLQGKEKRDFAFWLIKKHPHLREEYAAEPALLRLQCEEIRKGKVGNPTGLNEAILKKYASSLMEKYLGSSEKKSFLDYLKEVTTRYPSEAALRAYIEEGV